MVAPPTPSASAPPPATAQHDKAGPIWTWTSAILLVLNLAGLILLWPMFVFITPRFAAVYADIAAELPGLTRSMLWLSNTGWLIALFVGLLGVLLVLAQGLSRRKRIATWLNVAVGVLMGAFLLVWVIGLALPMFSLIQSTR